MEHATLLGDKEAGAKLFGGASTSAPAPAAEEEDDEIDLFGSDEVHGTAFISDSKTRL